ncbi:unnamed protein product [Caretta caretta]
MDPEEMHGRAKTFYASLFSPDLTNAEACRVLWTKLLMVIAGNRDQLELPLALAELLEALRLMPTNKSLGMDGLTVEFYRANCARLAAEEGGPLRPLELASRLAPQLQGRSTGHRSAAAVHAGGRGPSDQSYTIPGRTIFNNLYLVQDLLELGRRDGLLFALLSLNQEKASNRMDHRYLLGTLWAFSFGPQFMGFLQVLYAGTECLVRLNWTLTKLISFRRGVRQWCPHLGQLYALVIETSLCLLWQRLTGLVLREPELRLILYTDDVLLVVQDPGDLVLVAA